MPVDYDKIVARQAKLQMTNQECGQAAGRPPLRARQWWGDIIGRRRDIHLTTVEDIARALRCRVQDLLTEDTPGGPTAPRGGSSGGQTKT
jgi:hypothetical protein